MIRKYNEHDTDTVLAIWLNTSIKAHDFIEADFWRSQVENMRDIYLPASEIWVYEQDGSVIGFYALYESSLAAIFVLPEFQGQGIGKSLIAHAKDQSAELALSVYKANEASYQFYLSQGFVKISEQADPHTGHPEYTMNLRQTKTV